MRAPARSGLALALGIALAGRTAASAEVLELPRATESLLLAPAAAPVAHGVLDATSSLESDEAPLALAIPFVRPPELGVSISGSSSHGKKPKSNSSHPSTSMLTPERAQALLRSATYPGWGQATLGHPTAGAVFAGIEVGILASFVAFNIQEQMRHDSAILTARLFAGVDLKGKDDEFQKIVGAYSSSDEYNRLVVYRDAANLYYDDPAQYRKYIADHSLTGDMAWSWQDQASFDRYSAQRKDMQRAELRANTSLALMVANRLASVLHVVIVSGRSAKAGDGHSGWNLEWAPAGGNDPTAMRCALRTSF